MNLVSPGPGDGGITRLAMLVILAALLGSPTVTLGQERRAQSSLQPAAPQRQPAVEKTEDEALQKAITSAQGNPELLIRHLENFLALHPNTPQRAPIMRLIYQQALQANDPRAAADYAEKLLQLNPSDARLLAMLVDLLEQRGGVENLRRAAGYATDFIRVAEASHQPSSPNDLHEAKAEEDPAAMVAAGYLMRARVYARLKQDDSARADYEKCFALFLNPTAAEKLGDLAEQKGETARAIDEYATAFAFPERNSDPARRDQLRKKLGSAYIAKYGSEKGLGDLVLARYDDLMRSLKGRFDKSENPNASLRDPFAYLLKRPDGSSLRLSDYRGKIVVLDFWATWCGPCRIEGKLLDQVAESYRNNSATVFLAVNVDEDRDRVPPFLKEQRWTVPVAYAEGLDHLLGVRALPTLLIFDRQGRMVYRQEGLDPASFRETIEKKLGGLLGNTPATSPPAPSAPGR